MAELLSPFKERILRVLTSVNAEGKSYVLADGEPGDVLILNGCRMVRLWQTDRVPAQVPATADVTAPGLGRLPTRFEGHAVLYGRASIRSQNSPAQKPLGGLYRGLEGQIDPGP